MKKVLIIRFSSIGDIVLTTPVVRCIRQQLPEVELHYLTKEKFVPVISSNPFIERIHILKDDLASVIRELKEQDFDFIVDLHKNLRSLRVKMALGKPSRSFGKLNAEKWLMVNFKINRLPDKHIVDRYFEAVEKIGVVNDQAGLDYFIPGGELLGPGDMPEGFREGFVAFVIGGMHFTKMLPEEKAIELIGKLDMPVVLLGGPGDRDRGERIRQGSGQPVYNACGDLSINQSASVISMASKVLTNDTGLMHIAAAFGKEIYSFWGNTIPAFGMYPYLPGGKGKSVVLEVRNLSCRPCSKIGYKTCPRKHFRCMMDIDMGSLAEKLNA
ncbi:MAG TPA: glycosyltransferase family 9 protein [Bacteroidales bacterium]|nr:glycosyltransferase family 9 protein [Bacteroidales bacterium]